jgi:hypothetical protein
MVRPPVLGYLYDITLIYTYPPDLFVVGRIERYSGVVPAFQEERR